jgi:D-serine deaminase-like pyridoxal phosphate-dependent protein
MTIEERVAALDAVPDTPVLLLEAPVMHDNIARMAAATNASGKDLRPHAKTHKMPRIGQLVVDAGAVGLQLAKLGEAEVFVDAGAQDIFISNPIVGDLKIGRLLDLAERITISTSLDSMAVAAPLGAAAAARGLTLPVVIEIDTGQHRTGVIPDERAMALAEGVAGTDGLRLKGVMTHQGHAYAASTEDELAAIDSDVHRQMVGIAASIEASGIDCPLVSVGSTATSRFDAVADGITEVRPGMYVFNDATVVGHGHATWEQTAVWAVATVVSRQDPRRAVVDAGSKVLASDGLHVGGTPDTFGSVMGHPGHVVERVTEELGMLSIPPESPLKVGDRVAIVPNHICTAVNLADEVLVSEGGRIVDRWRVEARGKVT